MAKKIYINPMTGEQIISDDILNDLWCCLGDVEEQSAIPQINNFADVNMEVGNDFNADDDIFS